jgi:hypothetical protein
MITRVDMPTRRMCYAGAALITALLGTLASAGPAAAAPEPVVGGETRLTLELPKGVKVRAIGPVTADGNTVTLPTTGGSLDPATGAGTLDVGGALKFKGKRGKATLKAIRVGYGSAGAVRGQIGSKSVDLAAVTGGSATSQASSVSIGGATASLESEGAKALNKKLAKKKKKKKKKQATVSAAKPFKTGGRLGSLATTASFATVALLAEGEMELVPDLGTALTFSSKGVNPLTGVTAVPPATSAFPDFLFPVTGGRLLPDVSGGQIETGGGLLVTKNSAVNSSCDAARPIGTFLRQTELVVDLTRQALRATIHVASGLVGAGTVAATLDMSGATTSVNPATGAFTISDVEVIITELSATTLNFTFGQASQGCGSDFGGGDPLGTVSVSGRMQP